MIKGVKCAILRKIINQAEEAGWTVCKTNKNHLKFVPGEHEPPEFFSSTPGDWRAVHTLKAKLRRRGLELV
jgi:MinD-like ATPase involved in chromosome partitioning or flagellar assembly